MKKTLSYLTIILLSTLIIAPLGAKTISFNFGEEFTFNQFDSDGQAKGLAPGTKMAFNLHLSDALNVGFVSVSGDNSVSWDENYLGVTYNIFNFAGITFGAGGTTSDSNISTRSGIVLSLFTKEKDDSTRKIREKLRVFD